MILEPGDLILNPYEHALLVIEGAKLQRTSSRKARRIGLQWVSTCAVRVIKMGDAYTTLTKIKVFRTSSIYRNGELISV